MKKHNFQVATRKASSGMTTVFCVRPDGLLEKYRETSGERNFIEWIKTPIFLKAVLAIGINQEPQSNLIKKDKPSILKYYFASRTDPSIFTSITS